MNLKEFLGGAREIYDKFENNEKTVRQSGILIDPALEKQVGAYLIAGFYSRDVLLKVEDLSNKIRLTAPAIQYDRQNAHVSFVALTEDFFAVPDQKMIYGLCRAVERASSNFPRECRIRFSQPLFNQACVILEGFPQDDGFLNILQSIVACCEEENIAVKLPWGAHTTISRFTKATSAKDLFSFFSLMEKTKKETPFAETRIEAIGVGYCTASLQGFDLHISKVYEL